jgi:hypothetical protein
VHQGAKHRCIIFRAQVGPLRIEQKVHRDTLRRTFVFASGGICGSSSAFCCLLGTKCQHTIFHAKVGPVGNAQNACQDKLCRHFVLHLVGSAGHVVHSGASGGGQNIDTLLFMLWWDQYRFHKKRTGTRYAEPIFLHPGGSAGHVVHSGASEA